MKTYHIQVNGEFLVELTPTNVVTTPNIEEAKTFEGQRNLKSYMDALFHRVTYENFTLSSLALVESKSDIEETRLLDELTKKHGVFIKYGEPINILSGAPMTSFFVNRQVPIEDIVAVSMEELAYRLLHEHVQGDTLDPFLQIQHISRQFAYVTVGALFA